MALTKYKMGDLITQRREKNNTTGLPILGVSREGFIPPKQHDADTSLYNTFYYNDFVFNPARMELNSIALNDVCDKAICSSLYEVFYVKNENIVLPEFLNLFIKRDEFARQCAFLGSGSAREYCRIANISEIEILLPSINIQKRYVKIYKGLLSNINYISQGIEQMQAACDSYMNQLLKTAPKQAIGSYITEIDERNNESKYDESDVRGISTQKEFIPTKANMTNVSLNNYKLVRPNYFAYVSDTSRRGDKMSLAYNESENTYLVSSITTMFKITNKLLNPQFLFMFMKRPEFDRYARYNSWGSARETITWEDLGRFEIPIPSIEIQEDIVNIFNVMNERKVLRDRLIALQKKIWPILIKGAIEEGERA